MTTRLDVRVLDAFAVARPAALWILVGFLVFHEVRGLSSLSDTVVQTGRALDATSSALAAVAASRCRRPGRPSSRGARTTAARSAVANGECEPRRHPQPGVLLWIAIAAAPTTPLLVLYGLLREGWRRDVESLRELAAAYGDDAAFDELLARRALQHLPYRRLRRISENPWRDVEEGRTGALAGAEARPRGASPAHVLSPGVPPMEGRRGRARTPTTVVASSNLRKDRHAPPTTARPDRAPALDADRRRRRRRRSGLRRLRGTDRGTRSSTTLPASSASSPRRSCCS